MRLKKSKLTTNEYKELESFNNWILSIGNGKCTSPDIKEIENIIFLELFQVSYISAIKSSSYPPNVTSRLSQDSLERVLNSFMRIRSAIASV